jgi:hypothetical protein
MVKKKISLSLSLRSMISSLRTMISLNTSGRFTRSQAEVYSDWGNKGLLGLKQKLYSDWSTRSNQTQKYDLLQQGVYNND